MSAVPAEDRELRIGFLGSGFMAQFHLQALQAVRHCRVTAVHSPDRDHRERFAARANELGLGPCTALPTAEDLVTSPEVDAVWIAGPNDTRVEHIEIIHDLVASGEARLDGVAAEKPLGRTLAEASEIHRLASDVSLNHGYLENQVFAPAVRRGKDLLWRRAAGASGRPYLARTSEEHSGPHSPWFWQGTRQGGGALLDMMCHSVEVGHFLLTEPGKRRDDLRATRVTGTAASLKWSLPRYADSLRTSMGGGIDYLRHPVEDVAQGVVELSTDEGVPVLLQATTSWAYVGPGLRIAIEVLGPEYSMTIDSLSTSLRVFLSREVAGREGEDLVEKQNAEQGLMPVVEDEAAAYGYVAEDRHMVEAFRLGHAPEETFADGVRTMEVLMALYRSAEEGRTLELDGLDLSAYVPPVARSA